MPDPVYVFFTMDCEDVLDAPRPDEGLWGPQSDAAAREAIAAFDETLAQSDLLGTYFAVPSFAMTHADLLQALQSRGCEIGLHIHAQSLGDRPRWNRFFGHYPQEDQRKILTEGIETWTRAMGRPPQVYRPGNFSGDARLFDWLGDVGLRAGSVSLPGRYKPEYAADWRDAPTTAHLAPPDAASGQTFLNVPVTADTKTVRDGDPIHLRIEETDLGQIGSIIEAALPASSVAALPPTVTILTHNTVAFEQRTWRDRLNRWIEELVRVLSRDGRVMRNATMSALRSAIEQPHVGSSRKD